MLGNIHSIETFGSADGPGVRYLIFLKGCNMRCKYCHNPDTWAKTEGEMKSAEEILQQALRYKRYWGKKGGITVSGGEALLQKKLSVFASSRTISPMHTIWKAPSKRN